LPDTVMRKVYSPAATFANLKPPSVPVTTERCSSTISMVAPFTARCAGGSVKRPDTTAACALDSPAAQTATARSQRSMPYIRDFSRFI